MGLAYHTHTKKRKFQSPSRCFGCINNAPHMWIADFHSHFLVNLFIRFVLFLPKHSKENSFLFPPPPELSKCQGNRHCWLHSIPTWTNLFGKKTFPPANHRVQTCCWIWGVFFLVHGIINIGIKIVYRLLKGDGIASITCHVIHGCDLAPALMWGLGVGDLAMPFRKSVDEGGILKKLSFLSPVLQIQHGRFGTKNKRPELVTYITAIESNTTHENVRSLRIVIVGCNAINGAATFGQIKLAHFHP